MGGGGAAKRSFNKQNVILKKTKPKTNLDKTQGPFSLSDKLISISKTDFVYACFFNEEQCLCYRECADIGIFLPNSTGTKNIRCALKSYFSGWDRKYSCCMSMNKIARVIDLVLVDFKLNLVKKFTLHVHVLVLLEIFEKWNIWFYARLVI